MNSARIYRWGTAAALLIGLSGCASPTSRPAAGAFATGQYRNLFAEAGHAPAEVTAKIQTAFQQLFHGDPALQAIFYPAGKNANGPLAFIYDVNSRISPARSPPRLSACYF
jgi:hypothetical protein